MPARPDGTEPVIAHGSVYLRPAERDDLDLFIAWLNDHRTSRTLALRAPLSRALEERWFEHAVAEQGRSQYHFVVCRLDDARPVGGADLFELDLVNGSAGLGIVVGDPGDRGRGYGTDAIRALLAFAFGSLRLERVWLDVYDINPRAAALYARVGFVREGLLRHAVWREGRWVDVIRMAILADEWRVGAAGLVAGDAATPPT